MLTGWLINSFRSTCNQITGSSVTHLFAQTRNYAARKGTRLRKQKIIAARTAANIKKRNALQRKRLEVKKVNPYLFIDDTHRKDVVDNVWFIKYFKRPVYSFKQAIECHRETHHPSMYNIPDAYVNAVFDLNLQREKKTRFLEKFTKLIELPHLFEVPKKRTVLAFCKGEKEIEKAKVAGVDYIGGIDLIKQIQNGHFSFQEYDYVVAHMNIIPELLLIRGLLKNKFPNKKTGNMGDNISYLVKKFKHGVVYSLVPDNDFKQYGKIDCIFGKLNMDINHLEENFKCLIQDINLVKPKKDGIFFTRVQIASSPSPELFKIDVQNYVSESTEEEEEEDNVEDGIIATQ
ncbi:mitochondrial ribosomal protein L1 [Nomia melanderi]|uniref:mitochondrial ribosomal protein L1 n=1 Tax=Nomia melanderi TaxID=2448451 RepID=UPI0013046DB7|nr:uncharacterized protein LOC116425585 [Nomia melanderi]